MFSTGIGKFHVFSLVVVFVEIRVATAVLLTGSSLVDFSSAALIYNWINPDEWKLCFQKSEGRYDLNSTDFHDGCDSQGPTLVVVQLGTNDTSWPQGPIVGGFASQPWNDAETYFVSATSFLFSLTGKVRYDSYPSSAPVLYSGPMDGPIFGEGPDFGVHGKYLDGISCNLGRTYRCRVGGALSEICREDFCGSYSLLRVIKMEVWKAMGSLGVASAAGPPRLPKSFTPMFRVTFPGTKMMTVDEIEKVDGWLPPKYRNYEWFLCYRKTDHGGTATDFHQRCGNRGPSIVLAKQFAGPKIGGFASAPWQNTNVFSGDRSTFVFSLANAHRYDAVRGRTYGFQWGSSEVGPTFGSERDFVIRSDMHTAECNLGYTFKCRVGSPGSAACQEDFCGTAAETWVLEEVEVWLALNFPRSALLGNYEAQMQAWFPAQLWPDRWALKFVKGANSELNASQFHSSCDGLGASLVVIKSLSNTTGGVILGGYASHPWHSEMQYFGSSQSFLFSLTYKLRFIPLSEIVASNVISYMFGDPLLGPTFGSGPDLSVDGDLEQIFCNLGKTYGCENLDEGDPISEAACRKDKDKFCASNSLLESLEVWIAVPDTTEPVLASEGGVQFNGPPRAPEFTLVFSETVQAGAGMIELKTVKGGMDYRYKLASQLLFESNNKVRFVFPGGWLASGSTYTAEIESGALKDLSNNLWRGISPGEVTFQVGELFPGSMLLTLDEAALVHSWIVPELRPSAWNLCFRKVLGIEEGDYGMGATNFHRNCDDRGPSVVVVRSRSPGKLDRKIGGFASEAWNSNGMAYPLGNNRSFLFSLDAPVQTLLPTSHRNLGKYIVGDASYGPWFGAGPDFRIFGDLSGGSCYVGPTYKCRVGDAGSRACCEDFCGSCSSWTIVQLEVWTKNPAITTPAPVTTTTTAPATSSSNSISDFITTVSTTSPVITTGQQSNLPMPSEETDVDPPEIQLLGDASVLLNATNANWTDPGARCADSRDGFLQVKTQKGWSGAHGPETEGNFKVIYTCADSSGNTAQVSRAVTVSLSPSSGSAAPDCATGEIRKGGKCVCNAQVQCNGRGSCDNDNQTCSCEPGYESADCSEFNLEDWCANAMHNSPCLPGLTKLGMGFDVFSGELRSQIVNLNPFEGSVRFGNSSYRKATEVLVRALLPNHKGPDVTILSDAEHVQARWAARYGILDRDVASAFGVTWDNWKTFKRQLRKNNTLYGEVSLERLRFGLYLNDETYQIKLSTDPIFQSEVENLPTLRNSPGARWYYDKFLERHGTHYVSSVHLGGHLRLQLPIDPCLVKRDGLRAVEAKLLKDFNDERAKVSGEGLIEVHGGNSTTEKAPATTAWEESVDRGGIDAFVFKLKSIADLVSGDRGRGLAASILDRCAAKKEHEVLQPMCKYAIHEGKGKEQTSDVVWPCCLNRALHDGLLLMLFYAWFVQ